MSYILDALKRAEQERSALPPSRSSTAHTPHGLSRLRPATLVLAGATLFLAGIGAASLWLSPPSWLAAAPAPAVDPVPTAAPTTAPVIAQATAAPTLLSADDLSESLKTYDTLDDVTPMFQGSPATPAIVDMTTVAAVDQPRVGRVTIIPPPADESPNESADELADPPTLNQMPDGFRRQFPDLHVQVHMYDANPAKRWMMIDGHRHNQGSTLSSGPQLIDIRPNGAVFEFNGEQVFWPLQR